MSRTVRRQLIEILNTLKEANKLLESLFGGGQEAEIINLLAGCQNCAITMGNKIEAAYGTGTASVHALEEYCEIIFQLSQNIQNQSEGLQIYEKMKEQLLLVEENMEQEIPDKQEVVFMPYKASMWDALESVYLAAKEDESCEAYVVPIPYFDLNSDRSFGEMHYEGNEYPKNIEVIDWQSYNLEARMPDVIYIHNPYDDWNRVTSVHPKFYSSNLKKYTEKLVYIPYFVLQEIEPDDQAAIDQVKHFFFLPGIINADRVIVQSEKMKQIYINEYLKSAKAFGLTGAHLDREKLEEKFLGLGSPKFDKVLNTRREDLEMPEEWLRIIEKPDGTWKKIIFYNTSITALLQYDVKMLEKMRYVFRVFKEQQEEVALLWRPHPLIPSTIKSMRPHLWKEYEKIVEDYKCEGWGIYDDTADMDRAVALSDAYYGDGSSVVQVYQKTGKPIIIQDLENIEYENDKAWMDAIVDDGENIWFALGNYNGLYCYNKKTKYVFWKGRFPNERTEVERLYGNVCKVGDNLIFAPVRAKEIAIYNILQEKFTKVPITYKYRNELRCFNMAQWKNYIFFISTSFQTLVIRMNVIDFSLKYYLYELDECDLNKNFVGREVVIYEDSLYFVIQDKPIVIELDIEKEEFIKHQLSTEECFNTIACSEDMFFLSGAQSVIKWNPKTNVIVEYANFPETYGVQIIDDKNGRIIFKEGFQKKYVVWNFPFFKSIVLGNKLFLLSAVVNMSIVFDIILGTMQSCVLCEKETINTLGKQHRISNLKYLFLHNFEDKDLYFFSVRDLCLYKVDIKFKNIEKISMIFHFTDEEIAERISDKNVLLEKNILFSMEEILKSKAIANKYNKEKNEISFGKRIYWIIAEG